MYVARMLPWLLISHPKNPQATSTTLLHLFKAGHILPRIAHLEENMYFIFVSSSSLSQQTSLTHLSAMRFENLAQERQNLLLATFVGRNNSFILFS